MSKLNLESYIELIDRILERKGFSSKDREEILACDKNINMIMHYYETYVSPQYFLDKLDTSMVRKNYIEDIKPKYVYDEFEEDDDYLGESRRKPITAKQKQNKFKKVMGEFSKGKLKPFHSIKTLKSKKQGGSDKERKQALAIAFSEANMKKESYNYFGHKLNENLSELTDGQNFAVNFLKSSGLSLISTPLQIKRGNLIFKDKNDNIFMISNTGYIRKLGQPTYYDTKGRWQVLDRIIPPQYTEKRFITDEDYIEAAKILLQKIRNARSLKK